MGFSPRKHYTHRAKEEREHKGVKAPKPMTAEQKKKRRAKRKRKR